MTHDDLIKYYGNQTAAAAQVGLTQTRVSHWRKTGIPIAVQCQYEILTGGELKADRKAIKSAVIK